MIIHSYIISMGDDCDVLPDALSSLAHFSDRIYVVDGGMGGGTLCHRPRYNIPLAESVFGKNLGEPEFGNRALLTDWRGVPLTLWENPFLDPAHQRNYTLSRMSQEAIQPDWIAWIDSDEVCSWEFIRSVRAKLESLPEAVTSICPEWLTLVQDERHYFPDHSRHLAHARIHRPRTAMWRGGWHEDMEYFGERYNWTEKIVHLRELLRKRLWVQRGHPTLRDGWKNVECHALPTGVWTWPDLHYSQDELLPFDQDASLIWNKDGTPVN